MLSKKLTMPQRLLLDEIIANGRMYASDSFSPLKVLLKRGLVVADEGKYGVSYSATDKGRELARQLACEKGRNRDGVERFGEKI